MNARRRNSDIRAGRRQIHIERMEGSVKANTRKDKVRDGVGPVELHSWSAFTRLIEREHSLCRALIYRGQADADWPVLSTLDRLEQGSPRRRIRIIGRAQESNAPPATREEHLRAFQQAAKGRRGPSPPELPEDEWWALAQHHGLATPMLDWTLSPFVALFFAFEEPRVLLRSGAFGVPKHRVVYALSLSCIAKHHTKEDPAPRAFGPTQDLSPRLVNQAGVFLKMPQGCELEPYVRKHFPGEDSDRMLDPAWAILWKITMPNRGREECLQLLNKMNINRATLFPDLDGAAQYINALWELNFDTALGHLPALIQEQG